MANLNGTLLPSHIIKGKEVFDNSSGDITSIDPYTGEVHWSTNSASVELVNDAVSAAREAFPSWASLGFDKRVAIIENFTKIVNEEISILTELVAVEAGKPLWESKIEVNSLITKLSASVEAYKTRCSEFGREVRGLQSRTQFRPHGVMVVLGPYNFPLSMANGHIMPALLAGNTIVYKPSELTPRTGLAISQIWQRAGLPAGVLNCVSGNGEVGRELVNHNSIDGVLFIGSHSVGMSILDSLKARPEIITALEMGGNNPLIIYDYDIGKIDEIVGIIVQSTFISSGQRCSAARRLIISNEDNRLIDRLKVVLSQLRIGPFSQDPEPFYGPMIRPSAAKKIMTRWSEIENGGGREILRPTVTGPYNSVMSPGLIDMSNCTTDADEEIFGPVLKIYKYDNFDKAIELANKTKYGLSAGIVCQDRSVYDEFFSKSKSGIVNWNQQLTGATTFAPFGGVNQSGNFRPAGFLSADYCSYAVASFEVSPDAIKLPVVPGIVF